MNGTARASFATRRTENRVEGERAHQIVANRSKQDGEDRLVVACSRTALVLPGSLRNQMKRKGRGSFEGRSSKAKRVHLGILVGMRPSLFDLVSDEKTSSRTASARLICRKTEEEETHVVPALNHRIRYPRRLSLLW